MFAVVENQPLSFNLWGYSADVLNNRFGEVGFRLMNEMWRQLKSYAVNSTGTNHWVYLDDGRMFVGVELLVGACAPASFENLQFQLSRYVRYLHIGEYQILPSVWQRLMSELQSRGERVYHPRLEVYGHQSPDASNPPETTIIIALETYLAN